ncbi:MAG: hypothetical protein GY954_19930 [Alteromonas sp.]|nr:hypothetical protein [Alteromonas sp.]
MSLAEALKIDISPYVKTVMAERALLILIETLLENKTAIIDYREGDVVVTVPTSYLADNIEIAVPIKTMQELCKDNEVDYNSLFE